MICYVNPTHANDETFEPTLQPITITIAINKTTYPYMYLNDAGKADSLMPDLWRLWAKRQDVEIQFITSDWLSTLSLVESGKVDIHGGMTKTVDRNKKFAFTPSFFSHDFHFYIHRDFASLTEINQLSPYLIGSVRGSSHAAVVSLKYPTLKLRLYDNRHELYEAALSNEIIVYTGLEKPSKLYPRYSELTKNYPPYKRLNFHQGAYVAATALNNTPLKNFIVKGFDKMTQEEKSTIEKKWLGRDTKSETLLISFLTDAQPYMAISSTGKPLGLFVDLWRLWSKTTGIDIEFIAQSYSQGLAMLKKGEVDIHIGYSAENLNDEIEAASQIYGLDAGVFVSKNLENIYSMNDLSLKKIGVLRGTLYEKKLSEQYPNLNVQTFNSPDKMLTEAKRGGIDAMVSAQEYLNARLIQSNLQSSFYQLKNMPMQFAQVM